MSYSFDLEKSKSDMDVDSNPDEELNIDEDDSDDEEANHFKAMIAFADMLNADADLNNVSKMLFLDIMLYF